MHEGWKKETLGSIATNVKSVRSAADDTDIPYVALEHMTPGEPFIREYGSSVETVSVTTRFQRGDVLFGKLRPYLNKVAVADREGCCTNEVLVWRSADHQRLLPEFLALVLRDRRAINFAVKLSAGTRMPRTSASQMNRYEVALPPLIEQKRIVDLMASVDGAVAANYRLVESNRHARSVMLTTALSRSSAADSDHWESKVLADLCGDGGTIQTGPFGSQLHSYDYVEEGTPVVMPTNMWHGRIVLDGIARVKEEDRDRLSRHSLRTGDIVYSRRGDVTKSAQVTDSEEGFLCGTGCLLVRPNSDVHSDWLYHWLNRDGTKKWVVDHAVGATMANLNTKILGRVPVDVPPASTQRKIAELANAFDAMDQAARENLSRYRDLRSNILSSLLSGNHRIQESYDDLLGLAA